jgi:RND family efflux transporter MFP subunit
MLGVLLANESVDLTPRSDGRVERMHVRLGDRVARGALVATLDTRAIRRELAIGEAQLEQSRAEVSKAELDLAEANERLERRQAPLREGIQTVSGEELSGAAFRSKQAVPQLGAARARVAERKARVEQLRQQVADAELRAPFDGVVAARYVDAGAMVGARSPIVRIISSGELWVRFAAAEEQVVSLKPGRALRVQVSGVAQPMSGVIEKVAPEIDAASRMVFAEARLRAPEGVEKNLLSGRVGRVFVQP